MHQEFLKSVAKEILHDDDIKREDDPIKYCMYLDIISYVLDCEYNKRVILRISTYASVTMLATSLFVKNLAPILMLCVVANYVATVIAVYSTHISKRKAYRKLISMGYKPKNQEERR